MVFNSTMAALARFTAETLSGGVGLIDFDDDGWIDVYCVQGGAFEVLRTSAEHAKAHGTGDWRSPVSKPRRRTFPTSPARHRSSAHA